MIVIYLWQPYQRIVVQSFSLSHIVGVLLRIVYRQVMVQNIVYHTRRQESHLPACLCPAEATDSVQLFWLLTTGVIKSIAQSRLLLRNHGHLNNLVLDQQEFLQCGHCDVTLSWHWKVKLRETFINIFRWTEQSTLGNHSNPAAPLPSKGIFAKYWRKEGIFCLCLYRPSTKVSSDQGNLCIVLEGRGNNLFQVQYWQLSL